MEEKSCNIFERNSSTDNFWFSKINWCPTSSQSLLSCEMKLFNYVKNKSVLNFVPIENQAQFMRSLECYKAVDNDIYNNKIPIVLIHGLGGGVGLWVKNLDSISDFRKVFAMDLLGFGFSSRPKFPEDPVGAESMFVESLEQWRKAMNLNKFILLGHSLGGYLACAYAFKYPEYIRHLILADPWGIIQSDPKQMTVLKKSAILRTAYPILKSFNPMSLVRMSGPFGRTLINKFMSDFASFFQNENDTDAELGKLVSVNSDDVLDYIYHCNAQYPSGEIAFKSLLIDFGTPCRSIVDRMNDLDESIPISFIYGGKSWMDVSGGLKIFDNRPDSYVDIRVLPDIGHHIYVQDAEKFNLAVNEICETVDSNSDSPLNATPKERYKNIKQSFDE